jgi:hypothetical protein
MFPVIEQFLTEKGSLGAFLCLIILKLGEYVFHFIRNRVKVTDDTLVALKVSLDKNTLELAATQVEVKKFRQDLRKAFFAIKKVAGDEGWAKLSSEMNDKFPDL